MNDITPKEAIANLNHLYGMVAPDMQRSLDVAIKALERPQGDCISREALREDLRRFFPVEVLEGIEPKTLFAQIMHDIDNAPTVDIKDQIAGAYNEGYVCGSRESERKKGEWINREAVSNTIFPFWERYECNQCHKFNGHSNFCPNCGAKMKGGAEWT